MRTTVDGDRIQATFHGQSQDDSTGVAVSGPHGPVSCSLGFEPGWCEAPVAGVYTFTVSLYYRSGSGAYLLGVDSWATPSSCPTLDEEFFAVGGPSLDGVLPAGSAGDCYRFDSARAGDELRVTLEGQGAWFNGGIENAAHERLCNFNYGGSCTLAGEGPYQFFLYEGYGNAVDYRLRVIRISRPAGCSPWETAHFGPVTAAQKATGDLGSNGIACHVFTARAGMHIVRMENTSSANWSIRGADDVTVCEKWGAGQWCELPADGTYTMMVTNSDTWGEVRYEAVVVALTSDEGCTDRVGTAWDQPATRVELNSTTGVACLPFEATPGERVEGKASPGYSWITDGTGRRICDDYSQDGCVLPGAGPYRLLGLYNAYGSPVLDMEVRSLSAAVGCPVVTPGSFGTAPGGFSSIRCRTLTVPAAGPHLVRAVTDDNLTRWVRIYDPAGARVCDGTGAWCTFPAAGSYTLVVDAAENHTVVLVPASAPGCVPVTDRGATDAARAGAFTGAGQTDCYQLPSPAGATVAQLLPGNATGGSYPDLAVYDATGAYLCESSQAQDFGCPLDGVAPFRAVVTPREDYPAGSYRLAFQRTDAMAGCGAFPQGQIGTTTGTTATFTAGTFATCLAIPAGQHAAQEIVAFARTAGTGKARVVVYQDSTGKVACVTGSASYGDAASGYASCTLDAAQSYSALMIADAAPATYRLSRRDSTPAGARCAAVPSTTVGSRGVAGTVPSRDDVRCYRITGAAATDAFWVGIRSHDRKAQFWVTDAAGSTTGCLNTSYPCRVTGSTGYQMFVTGLTDAGAVPYELEAWKISTKSGLPAECPVVASTAYGFGPVTGVLDTAEPAACLQVPARAGDSFAVTSVNTEGGAALPEPFIIGGGEIRTCYYGGSGRYCPAYQTGTSLVVLWAGPEPGRYPFRAEATCQYGICNGARFTATSLSPASGITGGKSTITVRGSTLHLKDVVRLTAAGRPTITATVKTVSADRTTLTAEADLAGAATGARSVTVTSYYSGATPATVPGTFTVAPVPPAALKNTRAPLITGAVRVGSKVTVNAGSWTPAATAYSYRWTANGVTISGATGPAYVISAAVVGKKLSVAVTAKRSGHPSGTRASAAVTVAKGLAPKASKAPKITGTAKKSKTVKVAVGTWSPQAGSYTYQWRLNGVAIKGATKASLKLTAAMVGKKLTVVVTARRTGHADGRATTAAVKVKK